MKEKSSKKIDEKKEGKIDCLNNKNEQNEICRKHEREREREKKDNCFEDEIIEKKMFM